MQKKNEQSVSKRTERVQKILFVKIRTTPPQMINGRLLRHGTNFGCRNDNFLFVKIDNFDYFLGDYLTTLRFVCS